MSALGQKRTFASQKVVSALPPKADIARAFMSTLLLRLLGDVDEIIDA